MEELYPRSSQLRAIHIPKKNTCWAGYEAFPPKSAEIFKRMRRPSGLRAGPARPMGIFSSFWPTPATQWPSRSPAIRCSNISWRWKGSNPGRTASRTIKAGGWIWIRWRPRWPAGLRPSSSCTRIIPRALLHLRRKWRGSSDCAGNKRPC